MDDLLGPDPVLGGELLVVLLDVVDVGVLDVVVYL